MAGRLGRNALSLCAASELKVVDDEQIIDLAPPCSDRAYAGSRGVAVIGVRLMQGRRSVQI